MINADVHREVQQCSVASGLPDNFIKWPHVPGWEKYEDLIKPSKTLAFAVMISLPLSAYEGQMGMNHGMGVRSQNHAIFMSRCALGRSFQSSDPVLSICFPELQIVPLPSCCFMSCKCKFALWQSESYVWWRFRHPILCVCRSYVSQRKTFWCVLLIVYICYQRGKKTGKESWQLTLPRDLAVAIITFR